MLMFLPVFDARRCRRHTAATSGGGDRRHAQPLLDLLDDPNDDNDKGDGQDAQEDADGEHEVTLNAAILLGFGARGRGYGRLRRCKS